MTLFQFFVAVGAILLIADFISWVDKKINGSKTL